jgi:hypothetical protein
MFDTVKRCQLNGPEVTESSGDVTTDILLSSSSSSDNSPPPSKRPAWLTTPRPSGDTRNGEYNHSAEVLRIMKLRCPSADCPRWHFSPHRVLGLQIHHKQYRAHRAAGILVPATGTPSPYEPLSSFSTFRRCTDIAAMEPTHSLVNLQQAVQAICVEAGHHCVRMQRQLNLIDAEISAVRSAIRNMRKV